MCERPEQAAEPLVHSWEVDLHRGPHLPLPRMEHMLDIVAGVRARSAALTGLQSLTGRPLRATTVFTTIVSAAGLTGCGAKPLPVGATAQAVALLPGDLLSGAGLRIAYSVAQSIPVVGTWLALGFFGGPFPNPQITQRLYISHVWIVPLLIAGAIALHLGMVWRQHHTQFAGPLRTEQNVVGSHLWPHYTIKSLALMSATFAVVALLGGFVTINPIWMYGPYDGWTVASPAQPDWYVAWLDGSLRLGPALAVHVFGHTIPPVFWSGILLPLAVFGAFFAWPEIERSITRDEREHNIDDMPYEQPWRLGAGVAVITFGTVLGFAGSDDIQAMILHIDVETLMIVYRWLLVIGPFTIGALAVVIGFDLRARFLSRAGESQVRRATLRRNAEGGFDEERNSAKPA